MSDKRQSHHEEHIDETWLIPYADLLTLLLALFIVLFASSTVDTQKYNAMKEAFNSAFSSGSGVVEVDPPAPPTEEENNQEESTKSGSDLEALKKDIDQYIVENNLSEKLQTKLSKHFLMLTIRDNVLFDSNSAVVKTDARQTIGPLGELLVQYTQYELLIMGHTDNRPIHTAKFPSNWELSSQRALNFMKLLLENPKLDPSHFGAIGYAEYRPIATNASEEGRAKNRRVEIAIKKTIIEQ